MDHRINLAQYKIQYINYYAVYKLLSRIFYWIIELLELPLPIHRDHLHNLYLIIKKV